MAYFLIRLIFRITNRFYFRNLQVSGLENIPKAGPVFLVANHPSTFMDPLVIATATNRPLYFLGKGVLFQNKLLKWLLPKFHVIPIYRSHETPGETHKNKDVFTQCYKHFAKGGALLAFPEGISLTERKIKKIQSGTARICLGAEAENNYSLDIKIIVVGLNFSDPHKFRSDLFINIDKPINVSDFYEQYKQDTFRAAHALTDEIRKRMETQVVAIQDADVDKLVADIELIFKAQLLKDLGHSPGEMENVFNTTKTISDCVHYFVESQPERVAKIRNGISSYLNDLERLSLTDNVVSGSGKKAPVFDALRSICFLFLGLPFFVFGFINNFLPWRIPGWAARAISKREEFYGSIALTMGTFMFIVFYSLQIWLINKYTHDWRIVLGYAIALPLSGLFAFYYYKRFTNIRNNWVFFSLFYKKTGLISSLVSRRQTIIEELEKGRQEYLVYRDRKSE